MTGCEEDVQKHTDRVAQERPAGAASDKGLNHPKSKPVSERDRHRETCRGKNQSYQ
jgi:hypothetical protein